MSEPAIEIISLSPDDTLALGRRLANLLRPADVIVLAGPLGCGKTLLASGIAEGLGVTEPVTSPSFVIVQTYQGFMPVVHADVYRLATVAEFDDLELQTVAADGVLMVEWGDAVGAQLPSDHLVISLAVVDEHTRRIELTPMGSWRRRPLQELTE